MTYTIIAYRVIGNDFNPYDVSQAMCIKPTSCFQAGDNMGPRATAAGHVRKNSFWCVEKRGGNVAGLSENIVKLLENIPSNAPEIIAKFNAEASVFVSIIAAEAGCGGDAFLSEEAIGAMADLKLHFSLIF